MGKLISKTQYLMGLQCPRRLWLYRNRRALLPPTDPAAQALFDSGAAVGALARGLFPGGVMPGGGRAGFGRAVADTVRAVRGGAHTIYEAAVQAGGMFARCDILRAAPGGAWDIIEVKSSLSVKEEHSHGLAAQAYALRSAGLRINRLLLLHINKDYVRRGPVGAEGFFTQADLTAAAEQAGLALPDKLAALAETVLMPDEPLSPIGAHCLSPHECPFRKYCWKGLPPFSIYDVPKLSWEARSALRLMGVTSAGAIPESFPLEPFQRRCAEAARTGKTFIDPGAIRTFLAGLAYPLYYLDFETVMPAIPLYEGTRPYQQVPFQASLHVQTAPGAAPRHFEYLGDPAADPRQGLADFLLANIGPGGSLVAYNSPFEEARLRETAADLGGRAAGLEALAGRLKDLASPFRDRDYVPLSAGGSYSLKKILPAIAPELAYDGLQVSGGAQAQQVYMAMIEGRLSGAEQAAARENLKIYCGRDTLAMVRIMQELYRAAGHGG